MCRTQAPCPYHRHGRHGAFILTLIYNRLSTSRLHGAIGQFHSSPGPQGVPPTVQPFYEPRRTANQNTTYKTRCFAGDLIYLMYGASPFDTSCSIWRLAIQAHALTGSLPIPSKRNDAFSHGALSILRFCRSSRALLMRAPHALATRRLHSWPDRYLMTSC